MSKVSCLLLTSGVKRRYGKINGHNAWVPRDIWLEPWEREAIVKFFLSHPEEGYCRLAFMMLDADIVAVSPSSVYRLLSAAGLLRKWNPGISSKGQGFKGPKRPHEHWHIDISYLNIRGTFYYLCSVLDGYSRYIMHWEIRETMTESDVEIILQRARERFLYEKSRVKWPIIYSQGFQGVHKDQRDGPCKDIPR